MSAYTKDHWDLAARRVLQRLVAEEGVELVSSHGVSLLTTPLSAFLLQLDQADGRAEALADWLIDQTEVADLFASNEDLDAILAEEWDAVAAAAEAAGEEEEDEELDDDTSGAELDEEEDDG
jgi:ABC-type sugar transport system substrate-binding protein